MKKEAYKSRRTFVQEKYSKKSTMVDKKTKTASNNSIIPSLAFLISLPIIAGLDEFIIKTILSIWLHESIYMAHINDFFQGAFIIAGAMSTMAIVDYIQTKQKSIKLRIILGTILIITFCTQLFSYSLLCENDIVIKSGLDTKRYAYSDESTHLLIEFYYWNGKSPGPRINFTVSNEENQAEFQPSIDSDDLKYCAKVYSKLKDRSIIDISDDIKYKDYIKSLNTITKSKSIRKK